MSVSNTTEKLSYLDTSLPLTERVKDLIGRMTLEEKVGLMNHSAHGIPRLNIPAYNYWSEALHGIARNGRATDFPQAIAMAATWDKDLIHKVATAISDEGCAKYHAALKRNGYTQQYLTFWSPNVNIFRDPRWGRGQETWGEDPFFTGEMASEFVRGLQGDTDPDVFNQTTVSDTGMLLADIYQCAESGGGALIAAYPQTITPEICQRMIDFLAADKIGVLIEAGVPEGTRVAHKHGWISEPSSGVIKNISDAAIVYTPGGNYVLAIYAYHPVQTILGAGLHHDSHSYHKLFTISIICRLHKI